MFNRTEQDPTSAIAGSVVLAYGDKELIDCEYLMSFLCEQYGYKDTEALAIDTHTCDLEGYYLTKDLYEPRHIDEVEEVLWVLSDVLGNVELEDWSIQHTPVVYNTVETAVLHEGYYTHGNVTLRVFIIQ